MTSGFPGGDYDEGCLLGLHCATTQKTAILILICSQMDNYQFQQLEKSTLVTI
jgi:hypothetical protein